MLKKNTLIAILIVFTNVAQTLAHTQVNIDAHTADDCQVVDDLDGKTRLVESMVTARQPEVRTRYGQQIALTFKPGCILQAQGGHDENAKIVLIINRGILARMSRAEVAAVTCHELGHILGRVTLEDSGGPLIANKLDSVEGEADYYAGKCLLDTLNGDLQLAENTFKSLFMKLYRATSFNLEQAQDSAYTGSRGINPAYPNRDCRLWSSISGLYGMERPKCWYNPQKVQRTQSFPEKTKVVEDILSYHRSELINQYNESGKFKIINARRPLARADLLDGIPFIQISEYSMAEESITDIALTACHELGHFLGQIKASQVGLEFKNFDYAIEGEADYFSGKCFFAWVVGRKLKSSADHKMCETLGTAIERGHCSNAIEFALEWSRTITSEPLNLEATAEERHFDIEKNYPSGSCRILSVLHGILGKDRPQCWYNPRSI